eukprot:GEMP01009477.1.p1 GENE.GEMP01009477.1~~GEMP01009477.1.p1  ORF type:complete len:312 (+),score=50.09 GEMP01009477.1:1354-2289(+)
MKWCAILSLCLPTRAFSPIIGIVAQPIRPSMSNSRGSYVISSYIKWIEAQGADIAVLRYDEPEAVEQARKVHGILFPGGASPTARGTAYGDFSYRVFSMALKNKIPVWGTCLGFEQLLLYTHEVLQLTGTPIRKSHFDAENLALPFVVSPEGVNHPWWTGLTKTSRDVLRSKPVALHYHQWGFSVHDFVKSSAAQVWDLVVTGWDRNGLEFASATIMKDYKVWATQFHPEKNAFEHHGFINVPNVDVPARSRQALQAMVEIGHDFIDAAAARPWGDWDVAEMKKWSIDNWNQLGGYPPISVGFVLLYSSVQ